MGLGEIWKAFEEWKNESQNESYSTENVDGASRRKEISAVRHDVRVCESVR